MNFIKKYLTMKCNNEEKRVYIPQHPTKPLESSGKAKIAIRLTNTHSWYKHICVRNRVSSLSYFPVTQIQTFSWSATH